MLSILNAFLGEFIPSICFVPFPLAVFGGRFNSSFFLPKSSALSFSIDFVFVRVRVPSLYLKFGIVVSLHKEILYASTGINLGMPSPKRKGCSSIYFTVNRFFGSSTRILLMKSLAS